MWLTIHALFVTPVAETMLKPGPGWETTGFWKDANSYICPYIRNDLAKTIGIVFELILLVLLLLISRLR